MQILVTGGAGYIGSHVVKKLLDQKHKVVVLDNLARGHRAAVPKNVPLIKIDLRDGKKLAAALQKYKFDAVMHFAALAYVGESIENPRLYYENNVLGGINLLEVLKAKKIKRLIFSSSCSVYGNPKTVPITEKEALSPINPYALTKLIVEQIIKDYAALYGIDYVILRYFNAAGADLTGALGESHNPETHLIPLVLAAARKKPHQVKIFGSDYPTPDGTCIRDYIHVTDLAEAHAKALDYLDKGNESAIINLGSGKGYSVKEIIKTSEEITGVNLVTKTAERRPGDPAKLVADNRKAKRLLNWQVKYDLKKIIQSAWLWENHSKY